MTARLVCMGLVSGAAGATGTPGVAEGTGAVLAAGVSHMAGPLRAASGLDPASAVAGALVGAGIVMAVSRIRPNWLGLALVRDARMSFHGAKRDVVRELREIEAALRGGLSRSTAAGRHASRPPVIRMQSIAREGGTTEEERAA